MNRKFNIDIEVDGTSYKIHQVVETDPTNFLAIEFRYLAGGTSNKALLGTDIASAVRNIVEFLQNSIPMEVAESTEWERTVAYGEAVLDADVIAATMRGPDDDDK